VAPESIAQSSDGMGLAMGSGTPECVTACQVSPVIVGRDRQLAALEAALAATQCGEPAAVR
jgi:hypothetical protein